ncbi:SDR family oxidoreductase [Porticoccaceae bacterium]|nr:SDR family oxidoreductase [Porticoccaceae bacterium]
MSKYANIPFKMCVQHAPSLNKMKVLVTGATGFIGSALIDVLITSPDYDVVGMIRSKESYVKNPEVEYRLGEIGSSVREPINLNDIDVIVHTAGRAHIMHDRHQNPVEEFRRVNTSGTINLARLAVDSGVKRFVFLSSIKVNGESTDLGIPFSIDSIEDPRDAYGVSKYEAERGLRDISRDTGLEVTIIRPPLVYGPGVKGNFNTLIRVLSSRIPLPLGSVKNNRRSMVGLDNLLSMIVTCVRHPMAANQTFLVSDKADLSTYSLLSVLGTSIGKPAVLFKFPIVMLAFIAKFLGMETNAQRIMGTLQVDISHTCSQLGWEPPFSVEYGLKKLSEKVK